MIEPRNVRRLFAWLLLSLIVTARGANKEKNTKRPILRPIICICNDINASSLVKLRPRAYQIRLQRPADIHTVKRLKQVCEDEGLRADGRALSALVGIAKGDLRGCLNTLQVCIVCITPHSSMNIPPTLVHQSSERGSE